MRKRGLSFLLVLGLSVAAFAADRKLDLSTLDSKVQILVLTQFPQFKNGSFTEGDLDALLRFLVGKQQFDSAAVEVENLNGIDTYRLALSQVRKVSSLKFTGVKAGSEFEMRRELQVGEDSIFDRDFLIEGAERVRQYYRERGYLNAIIEVEYVFPSQNSVDIKINVKENVQTRISQVLIETTNPDLKEALRSTTKELEGEPYTDTLITEFRKDLREKLSEGRFYRSEISDPVVQLSGDEAKASLTIKIDKSERYTIDIIGTEKMASTEIQEALGLSNFNSLNPSLGPELTVKVRNFYLARGYARVDVRSEEKEGLKPFDRNLILRIIEGPRVKIQKLEVQGQLSMSGDDYVEFIEDHSSKLIRKGYYSKEDLDKGVENMKIDRQNNGFYRAKIVSIRSVYNKERDEIAVTVNFDEGPLTRVQKITFEGNNDIGNDQLFEIIGLAPQEPLRLNQLEEGIVKLKQFYKDNGYIEMAISNEKEDLVSYNEDNTLAHVKFKIFEGPKVIVQSILVEGNTITHESVILKELEFTKGDVLTPKKIDESISRLQRRNLFNSVDIRTLEDRTQIAQRTVVVRVTDRDPGLIDFGVGATSDRGFTVRGFAGVAYRNISGRGRDANIRLDGNYNISDIKFFERKLTLGYLEPYLFNTRTRGRGNFSWSTLVSDYDKKTATEIRNFTFSIEQDLTSHIFLTWDLINFSRYHDFDLPQAVADPTRCSDCTTDIGSTGPSIDIDFRDHPFNPTKGTFTRVNIEYGTPAWGSNPGIEFLRGTASFTTYTPLAPSWVWANSVRGGVLQNLSAGGAVPYDKKGFTMGGESTLRGFSPEEAFPNSSERGAMKILMAPENNNLQYPLTTKASMSLFKTEVRFPVYGENIGGALFYDGGMLKIDGLTNRVASGVNDSDLQFNGTYRDAIGIAFRYMTPIGPITLEYAFKLKPNSARKENSGAGFLSIGSF